MLDPEVDRIAERILEELARAEGEIRSTDDGWCARLGLPEFDYDLVQSAFVRLRNTGRIEWYRGHPGPMENNARLLDLASRPG